MPYTHITNNNNSKEHPIKNFVSKTDSRQTVYIWHLVSGSMTRRKGIKAGTNVTVPIKLIFIKQIKKIHNILPEIRKTAKTKNNRNAKSIVTCNVILCASCFR